MSNKPSVSCDACPFCSNDIRPPAYLAEEVTENVVTYSRLRHINYGKSRVGFWAKEFDDIGLKPVEDTVSLGIEDDEVRLWFDDRGLLEYNTYDTVDGSKIDLSQRGLDMVGAIHGDYVKLVNDEKEGLRMVRVTDRLDAPDYPLVAVKQPYTDKNPDRTGDYVEFGQAAAFYLDLHGGDYVTVKNTDEPDALRLVRGDRPGIFSYKVQEGQVIHIGAKALSELGVMEGDLMTLRPAGRDLLMEVIRGGDPYGGSS